jgi:hypothetical protein
MAEFEKLAADALVTPERVLPGQLQRQPPAIGGKLWWAGTAPSAEGCPAPMDQRPMPAENRGRLHQEESTGRQLAAEGSKDLTIGPPASELVELCVGGRAAPGGGRGVQDRDRQLGGYGGLGGRSAGEGGHTGGPAARASGVASLPGATNFLTRPRV